MRTGSSATRSVSSTRARWTPPIGSGSPPNWVTAKRYSSMCRNLDANTAHARIFTPATELPFAGHPTVGASWWLRDIGRPVRTLQVPAGVVQVQLRRRHRSPSGRVPNGRRISRSTTSSPPTSSSPPNRTTIPTTSRTTCGRGPTGTTACCAPGCSRSALACPRTRRPARPRFASPTTSAAISPSCRARVRSSRRSGAPTGGYGSRVAWSNDGTMQID